MNPILNNTPTYSHAESVASTSTHQASTTPSSSSGSDALQFLRQPVPDFLSDYERQTIMTERSDAFGRLISDFDPGSPLDFSGIDLSDIDLSDAVTSGLGQQWTDADFERIFCSSDDDNFESFVTNNGQLTQNQQIQLMNGMIDAIDNNGFDYSTIPASFIDALNDTAYAGDANISRFIRECNQQKNIKKNDSQVSPNINRPTDYSSPPDDFKLPNINGLGNVRSLNDDKNQYLAETTNTLVRNRFKRDAYKSNNKAKAHVPESVQRQQQARHVGYPLQKHIFNGREFPDFTLAMKFGMGNCDEMAGIAEQIINTSGGYARRYGTARLHTFTLVGHPPKSAKENVHFSDFGKCWVVDPWANITCKASEYTKKFKEKMEQWASEGKLIFTTDDRWISPTSSEWLDACIESIKTQMIPESFYQNQEEAERPDEPIKELPPPVREALDNLDPQKESTTTEDMQKALKKAKELGPDTFLQWLDEADVAKRLAEGILSGQSITSCGLLLEDLANDLLDLLKEGAVPAKRICEALFSPQAKEFMMAAIPQLMLKPAGVRLTRLMEQLAQKDEATRSDLVDSMSKRSCVPSIERANSEKSDFYDRVASVYDRSVFPKITAARKGKLRDHLPLAFYKQSSDTLENGNLMSIKHRRIASFTKIRNDAQKLAQAMNSDELGHRTITPEMLRETQQKDNENYEKQRNAIVNYRKIHIGNKISSDIIATVKQHMPEPEFVRNLNNLASEVLAFTNESNAIKEAEWESRQERIEVLQGSSDVATDGLFILAMAGAVIEATSSVEESMVRPAGRDINSMIGKGELKKAIDLNDLRNRLFDKFHGLWQETFKLLEGGVNDPYDGLLYTMLNIWETHLHLLALPNYALDLKEANEINSKMVQQLVRDGWLNSNNNPALDRFLAPTPTPTISAAPVVEKPVSKEPERQISAESASIASPPKKRTKTKKQALLA